MIRTGFYGGSFNPIHNGHIALARQFLDDMELDEVWFVVSPQNPFKRNAHDLMADKARFEIVRAATANEPRFCATDYELHLPTPSYTWQTLQSLAHDEPQRSFVLLIGADNWVSFPKWDHYENILEQYDIAIFPRRGYNVNPNTLPPNVTLLNTPLYDISSTDIRHRIAEGLPIDALVPPAVKQMVMEAYGNDRGV